MREPPSTSRTGDSPNHALEGTVSRPVAETRDAAMPVWFGEYRLGPELGRGGMGIVFRASQPSLGREVALKVLSAPSRLDPRALFRFQREARLLAQLEHPGIVRVIEAGSVGQVPFYAMDLVRGASLSQVVSAVRRHGLQAATGAAVLAAVAGATALGGADATPPEALVAAPLAPLGYLQAVATIVAQVADALAFAHAAGVVHRDVKPGNVLLRHDGSAVLSDFGIARLLHGPSVTVTGDFAGTPPYLAPEQARGEAVDHRADVYALGVTLYELCTLRRPFDTTSRVGLLERIQREDPIDPRRFNPAMAGDLAAIVAKAMAKEPAGRYPSAGEFAGDLRAWLAGDPVQVRRPTPWRRLCRFARREPWRATALTVVLATCGLVAGLSVAFMRRLVEETTRTQVAAALARANFDKAMAAVDQLGEVGARELGDQPGLGALRRTLLQRAADFYEDLRQQRPEDARLRLQVARAHDRLGRVRRSLGEAVAAVAAHRAAIAGYDALLAAGQCVDDARRERAEAQVNLAQTLADGDQRDEALALVAAAIASLTAGGDAATAGERRWLLSLALRARGELLAGSDAPGAMVSFGDALDQLEMLRREPSHARRVDLALVSTRKALATCALAAGDTAAAEALLATARTATEVLRHRAPDDADVRRLSVAVKDQLAALYHGVSRTAEAIATGSAAVDEWRQLVAEAPACPGYREALGAALLNLGSTCYAGGDRQRASDAVAESIAVFEQLAASFPDVARYRHRLARALLRGLGGSEALACASDPPTRAAFLARALDLAAALHAQAPGDVDYVKALAEALTRDADAATARGDAEACLRSLQRASSACAATLARAAGRLDLRDTFAVVLACLAQQQVRAGEGGAAVATVDRAVAVLRPALEREPRRPARRHAARALLAQYALLHAARGEHGHGLAALDELAGLCDTAKDWIDAAAVGCGCAAACAGDRRDAYFERALLLLRGGAACGVEARGIAADPRFDELRSDPRFAAWRDRRPPP